MEVVLSLSCKLPLHLILTELVRSFSSRDCQACSQRLKNCVSVLFKYHQFLIRFEKGAPFTPLEQLMAVLPPATGSKILPPALSSLMTDPSSPIIDFYPEHIALGFRFPST